MYASFPTWYGESLIFKAAAIVAEGLLFFSILLKQPFGRLVCRLIFGREEELRG